MQNYKIWSRFSTRQLQLVKQLKQCTGMDTTSKILNEETARRRRKKGLSRKTSTIDTAWCTVILDTFYNGKQGERLA